MNFLATLSAVTLLWTNPALNADGTPCRDLKLIRIEATREADGLTYTFDYPLWSVGDDGQPYARSLAGQADSAKVTVPLRTVEWDWWRFRLFAVDSTGNVSDPSNSMSISLTTTTPGY